MQNVFVQIVKCISVKCKNHLSKFIEIERYNETIGCHYKLADRQTCQERQKLGTAVATNCNDFFFHFVQGNPKTKK